MDDKPITVLVDRCVMTVIPDVFFGKSTLADIRKLFRYVFQEPERNTETIAAIGKHLQAKVDESKEDWRKVSKDFINGFVDVTFRRGLSDKSKNALIRANKKLATAVKQAKTRHERYIKILNEFEVVKSKNTKCAK